jgi:hypothetical protein
MTPEVAAAIEEIKAAFPNHPVDVDPEAQGGAYVTVHDISLGEQYQPTTSWVGFLISFQHPRADVYPHFIDPSVRRVDGRSLGEGFSTPMEWQGRQATQVSRRSNRWNALTDTAALKLAKVLDWISTR